MAGGYLITLYEYSPLFYISVVSLCFVVTAAMVLGWFGFDVPVILRSSDDTESIQPTPEKQMVQVTNPFSLEIGSRSASVASKKYSTWPFKLQRNLHIGTFSCFHMVGGGGSYSLAEKDGAWLKPGCLEHCVLNCFWGCEVSALQRALQAHQGGSRFSTPQHFKEALHRFYHHGQSFYISNEDREERYTCIPADQGLSDFGPLPRRRYPLVAVLTLAEQEARDTYDIVASVTVIHVPDDIYDLSARILFQYLLTSQGNMYELKALFMSANISGESGHPDPDPITRPSETEHEEEEAAGKAASSVEDEEEEDDKGWSDGQGRDCVVCQNAAINRVLLPCRHACVCDSCVSHFRHCPICRAFIQESFALTLGPAVNNELHYEQH